MLSDLAILALSPTYSFVKHLAVYNLFQHRTESDLFEVL